MKKRCSYSWDRLLHPRGPQCNVTRCSPQGINNNENYNMQYCVSQNYRLSTDVFLSTHNTTDIDRNDWYSSFNIFWFAAPCKPAGVSKTSMFQQKSLWCQGIGLSWTLDLWELWDCFVQTLKLFDVILISPIYNSHSSILPGFMVMTKVIICPLLQYISYKIYNQNWFFTLSHNIKKTSLKSPKN